MAIDRAWLSSMSDDSGGGTDGTVINKSKFTAIADAVDGLETGTWTPALKFGGASVGMTYSTQSGTYTRTGNVIVAEASIVLTAKGSSTGSATISGIPVAAAGFPVAAIASTGMSSLSGGVSGVVTTTSMSLYTESSAGVSALTDANFGNTSVLRISLVYRV